jgi:hypothetical protein
MGAWYFAGEVRAIYTRFSMAGAPADDGRPKLFIADGTYTHPIPDHRLFLFLKANGHNPADPVGMNAIAGDGSGKWASDIYDCSGSLAAPYGYYALKSYVMWADWGAISYNDPDGVGHAPRAPSPTGPLQPYHRVDQYNAALAMWGAKLGP